LGLELGLDFRLDTGFSADLSLSLSLPYTAAIYKTFRECQSPFERDTKKYFSSAEGLVEAQVVDLLKGKLADLDNIPGKNYGKWLFHEPHMLILHAADFYAIMPPKEVVSVLHDPVGGVSRFITKACNLMCIFYCIFKLIIATRVASQQSFLGFGETAVSAYKKATPKTTFVFTFGGDFIGPNAYGKLTGGLHCGEALQLIAQGLNCALRHLKAKFSLKDGEIQPAMVCLASLGNHEWDYEEEDKNGKQCKFLASCVLPGSDNPVPDPAYMDTIGGGTHGRMFNYGSSAWWACPFNDLPKEMLMSPLVKEWLKMQTEFFNHKEGDDEAAELKRWRELSVDFWKENGERVRGLLNCWTDFGELLRDPCGGNYNKSIQFLCANQRCGAGTLLRLPEHKVVPLKKGAVSSATPLSAGFFGAVKKLPFKKVAGHAEPLEFIPPVLKEKDANGKKRLTVNSALFPRVSRQLKEEQGCVLTCAITHIDNSEDQMLIDHNIQLLAEGKKTSTTDLIFGAHEHVPWSYVASEGGYTWAATKPGMNLSFVDSAMVFLDSPNPGDETHVTSSVVLSRHIVNAVTEQDSLVKHWALNYELMFNSFGFGCIVCTIASPMPFKTGGDAQDLNSCRMEENDVCTYLCDLLMLMARTDSANRSKDPPCACFINGYLFDGMDLGGTHLVGDVSLLTIHYILVRNAQEITPVVVQMPGAALKAFVLKSWQGLHREEGFCQTSSNVTASLCVKQDAGGMPLRDSIQLHGLAIDGKEVVDDALYWVAIDASTVLMSPFGNWKDNKKVIFDPAVCPEPVYRELSDKIGDAATWVCEFMAGDVKKAGVPRTWAPFPERRIVFAGLDLSRVPVDMRACTEVKGKGRTDTKLSSFWREREKLNSSVLFKMIKWIMPHNVVTAYEKSVIGSRGVGGDPVEEDYLAQRDAMVGNLDDLLGEMEDGA